MKHYSCKYVTQNQFNQQFNCPLVTNMALTLVHRRPLSSDDQFVSIYEDIACDDVSCPGETK